MNQGCLFFLSCAFVLPWLLKKTKIISLSGAWYNIVL